MDKRRDNIGQLNKFCELLFGSLSKLGGDDWLV
jgi:hypothetical protein